MNKTEAQDQALNNAIGQTSTRNYNAIFSGFSEKGIAENDILPRKNIFTFAAWLALDRTVKKGEHGIKICTFVPMSKTDKETGKKETFRRPRTVTVFHVSQTIEQE